MELPAGHASTGEEPEERTVLTIDHGDESPASNPWEDEETHGTTHMDVHPSEGLSTTAPAVDKPASTNPFLNQTAESASTPAPARAPAPAVPSTQPTYAQSAAPPPQHPPAPPAQEISDPRIAPLQAIFPDFDAGLLQSVLEACNGNQEQAIEMLLGMSDPTYVSTAPQSNQGMSQTDLDEQLAHRLMLEEEENAARSGNQSRGRTMGRQDVPYQPRQHVPRRQQPPPQGGGAPIAGGGTGFGGVNTAELQDQFNRIAETGKKTFSSIFSKVKQKMQELDQPQRDPNYDEGVPAGEMNQFAEYAATPAPGPKSPAGQKPLGYTVGAGPFHPPPPPPPKAVPATTGPVIREPRVDPSYAGTSGTSGPSGSSSSPPNIDLSRLNLLPKKPVSLVGSSAPGPSGRRQDDDEDLEYVENPFEDR